MRIKQVLAFLGAATASTMVLAAPAPVSVSEDGGTVYVAGNASRLVRLSEADATNAQGTFRLQDGRILRLTNRGRKMFMELEGQHQELLPTSRTHFVARHTGAELAVDDLHFPEQVSLTELKMAGQQR
jgi:DNA-binding beta-propeller fold protein YncE